MVVKTELSLYALRSLKDKVKAHLQADVKKYILKLWSFSRTNNFKFHMKFTGTSYKEQFHSPSCRNPL